MWNPHAFHLGVFIYIELLILSIRKTDVIKNTPTYGQKDLDANFLCVLFFFFECVCFFFFFFHPLAALSLS